MATRIRYVEVFLVRALPRLLFLVVRLLEVADGAGHGGKHGELFAALVTCLSAMCLLLALHWVEGDLWQLGL